MDKKKNVFLDTDIGSDIDDSWALALLLSSEELEVRGVSTVSGTTPYRAALARRLLDSAGKSYVPMIAGGRGPERDYPEPLRGLAGDFPPSISNAFSAASAIAETLEKYGELTLISIGPCTNIAALIECYPESVGRINLVSMIGRIANASAAVQGEYNALMDVKAAQKVFSAKWHSFTIVPWETGVDITLEWDVVEKMRGISPLANELALQVTEWHSCFRRLDGKSTSSLFDTAAVTLAFDKSFWKMERLPLSVSAEGITFCSPEGRNVNIAASFKDLERFRDFLRKRLANHTHIKP